MSLGRLTLLRRSCLGQRALSPFRTLSAGGAFQSERDVVADICVIGGGAIGSCAAYHIKLANPTCDVVVVERDLKFTRASTTLSVGSIRQQFSLPENILLSRDSFHFLNHIKENLAILDEEPPQIDLHTCGYLFLATPRGLDTLHANCAIQLEHGASLDVMPATKLAERFPWLRVDDLAGGSLGVENEGWFDPWNFLNVVKRKNRSMGVKYVQGNVSALEGAVLADGRKMLHVAGINDPSYPSMSHTCSVRAGLFVNAAGAWAGAVGQLAGVGKLSFNPVLNVPIPIEPRKRYVYVIHCPDGPTGECPLIVDPSGVYFRREGPSGYFICGKSPTPEEEPSSSNLEVDYDYFDTVVWPLLAHRVPAFENIKVTNAWAGYYDYNYVDQNGIIGHHPAFANFIIAAGFSGHGIQMSPAVGRAVAELVHEDAFQTIDLTRLGFERFLRDEPLLETNIV